MPGPEDKWEIESWERQDEEAGKKVNKTTVEGFTNGMRCRTTWWFLIEQDCDLDKLHIRFLFVYILK